MLIDNFDLSEWEIVGIYANRWQIVSLYNQQKQNFPLKYFYGESVNIFYKACTKFAHAEQDCIVMGTRVPCVLTSRGDSTKSKPYSIALAALQCK